MAEHNSRSGRSPKAGQGALSVLALATLAVVAALAGVILWLALSAGDTMERLRAEADRRGLYAELTLRSEEHTSELQSLMRISYAVFCLNKKTEQTERATH